MTQHFMTEEEAREVIAAAECFGGLLGLARATRTLMTRIQTLERELEVFHQQATREPSPASLREIPEVDFSSITMHRLVDPILQDAQSFAAAIAIASKEDRSEWEFHRGVAAALRDKIHAFRKLP